MWYLILNSNLDGYIYDIGNCSLSAHELNHAMHKERLNYVI